MPPLPPPPKFVLCLRCFMTSKCTDWAVCARIAYVQAFRPSGPGAGVSLGAPRARLFPLLHPTHVPLLGPSHPVFPKNTSLSLIKTTFLPPSSPSPPRQPSLPLPSCPLA